MKTKIVFLVLFVISLPLITYAQNNDYPQYFSWKDRFFQAENSPDYISASKDQLVQGPCAAFAATALLEAAIQIYFNTPVSDTEMNLSEQFIYSSCNYPDASPGSLSAFNALDIIKNY